MTARKHTILLLEMIDEGVISARSVAEMCLNYMSERDVEDMMADYELLPEEDEADEEWTPDNADFNDLGSRHHY